MGGGDLVVEDRDVGIGRTRPRARRSPRPSGAAAISPPRASSSASATRGRRPRRGRRRRPRARPAPPPSCRGPARRRGSSGGPRARSEPPPTGRARASRRGAAPPRGAGSASVARGAVDRPGRLVRLGPQRLERERGARGDLHAVAGEQRVEPGDDPRVERHRATARRAGQALEGHAGVGIPQHLEAQAVAVHRAGEDEPRRGGRLAALDAPAGSARAAASSRALADSRIASAPAAVKRRERRPPPR